MPDEDQPQTTEDELKAAFHAAQAATTAYADQVQAGRRQQFPAEDQIVERMEWPPEQTAELERLQGETMAALRALNAHRAQQATAE